jgi:hypothetical protein
MLVDVNTPGYIAFNFTNTPDIDADAYIDLENIQPLQQKI